MGGGKVFVPYNIILNVLSNFHPKPIEMLFFLNKMLAQKKEADRLTKIINFFLDVMKWNKHMTWVIGNILTMQCYQSGFYYI